MRSVIDFTKYSGKITKIKFWIGCNKIHENMIQKLAISVDYFQFARIMLSAPKIRFRYYLPHTKRKTSERRKYITWYYPQYMVYVTRIKRIMFSTIFLRSSVRRVLPREMFRYYHDKYFRKGTEWTRCFEEIFWVGVSTHTMVLFITCTLRRCRFSTLVLFRVRLIRLIFVLHLTISDSAEFLDIWGFLFHPFFISRSSGFQPD